MSALSKEDICNTSLIALGEESDLINSLEETTQNAIRCLNNYDKVRRYLLVKHRFSFAKKEKSLPKETYSPSPRYLYSYGKPPDCLQILSVTDSNGLPVYYEEFLDKDSVTTLIATDVEQIYILYISDVENINAMPETFCDYLSYEMALRMSQLYQLDKGDVEILAIQHDRYMKAALVNNAREENHRVGDCNYISDRRP